MPTEQTMRAWRLHEYGEPETVLKLENAPVPVPGPNTLLVKQEGISLNLNDLERINGGNMMVRPEFPYSPGMEVMGTVVATGEGAESWLGRRVCGTAEGAHGGWAEYCLAPQAGCFEMPLDIPMPDAAALFFPFHLAWLGLYDRARLAAGDWVLIHAAAGGSGSAAIQLAKRAGATVIATAGSDDKLKLCSQLGADHVLNYRDADIHQTVMALTAGRGVDVVFDNVGEAVMEASLKSLAYNGRYLMMGFASNKVVADEAFIVPRQILLSNASLMGVTLSYTEPDMIGMIKGAMGWNFPPRTLGESIHTQICEAYLNGEIKAVIGEAIEFESIPKAMACMARGDSTGRTVARL